jgi:hypothetical protein
LTGAAFFDLPVETMTSMSPALYWQYRFKTFNFKPLILSALASAFFMPSISTNDVTMALFSAVSSKVDLESWSNNSCVSNVGSMSPVFRLMTAFKITVMSLNFKGLKWSRFDFSPSKGKKAQFLYSLGRVKPT